MGENIAEGGQLQISDKVKTLKPTANMILHMLDIITVQKVSVKERTLSSGRSETTCLNATPSRARRRHQNRLYRAALEHRVEEADEIHILAALTC